MQKNLPAQGNQFFPTSLSLKIRKLPAADQRHYGDDASLSRGQRGEDPGSHTGSLGQKEERGHASQDRGELGRESSIFQNISNAYCRRTLDIRRYSDPSPKNVLE